METAKTKSYTKQDLDDQINRALGDKARIKTATVLARFTSVYVGGQPATDDGIKAFVNHQLGLEGKQADDAVERIKTGEVRLDTDSDELEEAASYGVKVVRRTKDNQAYIGTWQVRAMIKQAASRLGLFKAKGKVGGKGDLSEMMLVIPHGTSDRGGVQEIVICDESGEPYTNRQYQKFMGSVHNAKGRASIVHDSETIPIGSRIQFKVEWPTGKIKPDDMAAILGAAQWIGLGSVKAMEHGRFEIVSLKIG